MDAKTRRLLKAKNIWYVRHGEGTHNRKINGLYQNMGVSYDPGLTKIGRSQAQLSGIALKDKNIQLVMHSLSKRTQQTTRQLVSQLKVKPNVVSYATIHEINTGVREGNLTAEGFKAMLKDFKGAETPAHLQSRVMQALEFISRRPEENVVIVSHSRIGRMFFYLAENSQLPIDEFDRDHGSLPHDKPIQLKF